uniref:Leucine-rich repeat domain-containing protein n=1 Tax=Panagrolaimus sp. PS1159 TaxID=55785 RepID=A0AC35GRZ8_9BILA
MTVHEITPVKEIQIRCIKVFTKEVKGGINNEHQNQFKEYAEKINRTIAEILSENDGSTMSLSDAQEKAFETIGPLKLPFEASKKALNQKIMDLYEAIYDQCYNGSEKSFPSTSKELIPRYYYPIEADTSCSYFCLRNLKNRKNKNPYYMVTQKGVYDARGNITKELNTCTDLYFENIHLPKFDLQWFNAPAMISLSFVKCDIFQMPNAWKIFEENISKLSNIHILEIAECEITEIPETLFAKLPSKMESLNFEKNNLKEIPNRGNTITKRHKCGRFSIGWPFNCRDASY